MQRVLVILSVIALVTVSLGIGALAANWPFWRRAWAWHVADDGWPRQLAGPRTFVQGGGGMPLQFDAAAPDLQAAASKGRTQLLLRVRGTQADAWLAPGQDADTQVDGRGLAPVVLAALYSQLEKAHPGLLDRPVGALLDAWRQDQRGALTVRQMLALVAGGIDTPPSGSPLNPFSARARLAAGPGMDRAALAVYEPVGDVDRRAAAAQLLALMASRLEGRAFAEVLQQQLWSQVAAGEATLLLEGRRGDVAAHCCMQARAADWLRVALHPAAGAEDLSALRIISTEGRVLLARADAALLWTGEGPAPSGLETLLAEPPVGAAQ